MSQSIKGARSALYDVAVALYGAQVDTSGRKVLVSYGKPGSYQPDFIVALMNTRQPITRPTMGTNRSREKEAEIDFLFSCYVPGAEVAQQVATEACDDLIELLDAHFRTAPNETLDGACREAWVSNVEGPVPDVITDKTRVTGKVAEAIVTVTVRIRY